MRAQHWDRRVFYAAPCRYFIDVPLDMTGCILGATREATDANFKLLEGGSILATDALYRGAILVEIEDDGSEAPNIVRVDDLELLARELPTRGANLRAELDELVRWSIDLGHDVTAVYVRYEKVPPGAMRPTQVYAAVRGETCLSERPLRVR